MSWLARSIVNSLKGDDDEAELQKFSNNQQESPPSENEDYDDEDTTRGVKEDLSELTKTLTRQFWGVASFLAPPPSDQAQIERPNPTAENESAAESSNIEGIRNDLVEIGGKLRSGISLLSSTKAVSEISKIASNLLQFDTEDEEAIGINEEIVAFATNLSMHPETWIDFPLMNIRDDHDEFDMSDAQEEHTLAIERLAPNLAELRAELCPSHMSEALFWKIYFVLLHSRLNRSDADLLTTPEIIQAREMLLQDVQIRKKTNSEESVKIKPTPPKEVETVSEEGETVTVEDPSTTPPSTETEKHTVEEITEVKIVDKSVIQENPPSPVTIEDVQKYENEDYGDDDWLKEEDEEEEEEEEKTTNDEPVRKLTAVPLGNDEDVSFSDLEDDDS